MLRISRLPIARLLRSPKPIKPIPQPYRTRCTDSITDESDTSNARQLMEDPTNKHLYDEYHNAKGDIIFEYDPKKPLTDDDWGRFEAAFGLDKPIPQEDIRKWESMIEEFDPSTEKLPLGKGSVFFGPEDNKKPDKKEEPKRKGSTSLNVGKRPPHRGVVEHGLRQPLHRRPGYEKRVASMEAELTRLVTEVLIERGSDWYSAGADIHQVMLTPNLRNLTIYYTVDEEPHMGKNEWRRLNKAMTTRIKKEIFERMDVRYVPNVFFEPVSDESKTLETELDAAFAKIEAERLAKSTKPA